jgi:hypothetical protein
MLPNPFLNQRRRLRNGWWVAIFMLLLAALLAPLIVLYQHDSSGVPIWLQAAVLLVASVTVQMLRRKPMAELFGAIDARWPRQFALGAVAGALLMLAPALMLALMGFVEWRPSASGFSAIWPAFNLFVAVAVAEELMFRGFVFQRLIDGLGAWPAQVIVAAFFTLTHSSALQDAGDLAPMATLNIFFASIMFGLAFVRTRSLAMPIGIHFAANFVQGGVLGFGVSGNSESSLATPVLSPGVDWLTGGAFGLEASLPGFACVLVAIAVLIRWRPSAGDGSMP